MKMNFKLNISEEAQREYLDMKEYLLEEFGQKVRDHFAERVRDLFGLIAENPHLFPIYDKEEDIRRAVVIKEVSIYYEIIEQEVKIHLIIDNQIKSPEF